MVEGYPQSPSENLLLPASIQLCPSALDWCRCSSSWGPPGSVDAARSPLMAAMMFSISGKYVRDGLLLKETYPHHPVFLFISKTIEKELKHFTLGTLQLETHFTAASANGCWRGKTISFVLFWNFAALGKTRVWMRLAMEMSNAADQ